LNHAGGKVWRKELSNSGTKDVVIRDAAQAGYELYDFQNSVKGDGMDYFLIFTAKAH
jgi:hypothetical protein